VILLDTNIISEMSVTAPAPQVLGWLNAQQPDDLFLPVPVVAELAAGAADFARRTGSLRYSRQLQLVLDDYAARIVDVKRDAAVAFGDVVAQRNAIGRPIMPIDAMIAAICLVHGATLATRNVRDFDGLDLSLVNPFEASA